MNAVPSRPRQMAFDLAHRPAFGAEDFFLSQSNKLAIKLIDDWPDWAQYGQCLIGPEASGKSHLVNVWRLRTNAHTIMAKDLSNKCLHKVMAYKSLCVEDIDRGLASEEALFHLLNMVSEHEGHILLTTRCAVIDLDFQLKDLRSRLLALPSVSIDPPDDNLLKAVMVKQFADRQLEIEPQLVEYLFKRMERSMHAVARMVENLDKGSLDQGRAITKALAREILARNSS